MQEWYYPVFGPQQMGGLWRIPKFFRKLKRKEKTFLFICFSLFSLSLLTMGTSAIARRSFGGYPAINHSTADSPIGSFQAFGTK